MPKFRVVSELDRIYGLVYKPQVSKLFGWKDLTYHGEDSLEKALRVLQNYVDNHSKIAWEGDDPSWPTV